MLARWFRHKPAHLTGAPAVRRQKTYSAQSGYVYQYYYQGHRCWAAGRGTEFVFDVSADRKTSSAVSVFLTEEAVASWQKERGRTLSGTELYAIAKMALFQAFDERETPEALLQPIHVAAADVVAILSTLEID